jgi:flavin-dependent dehydrogenase
MRVCKLRMYDLIIVGGGPAGASAAITAAREGVRVLLIERGHFPRQKVCGEFVSAESLHLLGSLLHESGATLLRDAPRIARTRIFVDGHKLEAAIHPAAASIARFDMDAALWKSAESAGAELLDGTQVNAIQGNNPFFVTTPVGVFESRSVINATGRWSNLTSSSERQGHINGAQENRATARWIGVKAHFAEPDPSLSVDLYFFVGGYCGVQPVILQHDANPGRINACAMVRPDIASKLEDVFALNDSLRQRSATWQPLSEPVATSPLIFRRPTAVREGVLLAGDAAGFIDPFVGDGISLALRAGALAAQTLQSYFLGKKTFDEAMRVYEVSYEKHFARVFRTSSRLRKLLAMPGPVRRLAWIAAERSPALMRFAVESTR